MAAPYHITTRNMANALHSAAVKALAAYPLYSQEENADPVVSLRLFDSFGSAVWWLTEYDPGSRIAFGYVT